MNDPIETNNPHAGRTINLLYLRKYLGDKSKYQYLDYIHISRSPDFKTECTRQGWDYENIKRIKKDKYYEFLCDYLEELIKYFKDNNNIYDVIVYAPSCSNMHLPFFVEVVKGIKFGTIVEFSKSKSAGKSKRFKTFYRHFNLETPVNQIKRNLAGNVWDDLVIEKLLIVDDMYADGKTVGAIIKKLTEPGNEITIKEIDVFTPLIK